MDPFQTTVVTEMRAIKLVQQRQADALEAIAAALTKISQKA